MAVPRWTRWPMGSPPGQKRSANDRLTMATGASPDSFCTACLSGIYPVPVPFADSKHALEELQAGDAETATSRAPGA